MKCCTDTHLTHAQWASDVDIRVWLKDFLFFRMYIREERGNTNMTIYMFIYVGIADIFKLMIVMMMTTASMAPYMTTNDVKENEK